MKAKLKNTSINSIWIYRLVRWAFGAFFITIGFLYEDAWAAFIFGGIFILTSFYKSPRCIDESCTIKEDKKAIKI